MTDPGVVTLVGLDSCVRINKAQAGNRVHREGIVMPSRFGVSDVHRNMAIPVLPRGQSTSWAYPLFHAGYGIERSGEAGVPGGVAGFRWRHILRSCAWL